MDAVDPAAETAADDSVVGRPTLAGQRNGWWTRVGAIAALGLFVRVAYVLLVARDIELGADATWYLLVGGSIREGLGFVDPETLFTTGDTVATANFPPLYPAFLAAVQAVFGTSETVAQLAGAFVGATTVVLAAVMARRLAGDRSGVVTAALVAVSPMLIAADGSLMSEVLYVPLVTAAVLLALRAGDSGEWWSWVGLGVALGLAALTRTEALMLVVFLVLPILWWARNPVRERWIGVIGTGLVVLAVIAPWVLRNNSAVDDATISNVSPATALAGSNCDSTYSGPSIGSWEYECTRPELRAELGESEWTEQIRSDAVDHLRDNLDRLPLVLTARELRVWGLWGPSDLVRRDAEETRTEWFQWAVRITGVATLVAGAAGIWLLRGSGRKTVVLLAPIAMVATTALLSHGNPRFRTVAEPELLVGCAVALLALWGRRRGEGSTSWRT
ncbi:MAG: ArnT family glycosyltransferase [Microthrixaceae bacterium]